jgi:hypothetical protein
MLIINSSDKKDVDSNDEFLFISFLPQHKLEPSLSTPLLVLGSHDLCIDWRANHAINSMRLKYFYYSRFSLEVGVYCP